MATAILGLLHFQMNWQSVSTAKHFPASALLFHLYGWIISIFIYICVYVHARIHTQMNTHTHVHTHTLTHPQINTQTDFFRWPLRMVLPWTRMWLMTSYLPALAIVSWAARGCIQEVIASAHVLKHFLYVFLSVHFYIFYQGLWSSGSCVL